MNYNKHIDEIHRTRVWAAAIGFALGFLTAVLVIA